MRKSCDLCEQTDIRKHHNSRQIGREDIYVAFFSYTFDNHEKKFECLKVILAALRLNRAKSTKANKNLDNSKRILVARIFQVK